MIKWLSNTNYLLFSIVLIVLLYVLSAIQFYELIDSPLLYSIVRQHILSNIEFSSIEILSSLLWLFALMIFCHNLVRSVKIHRWNKTTLWFAFFALLCLAALGEETSWGQHYLGYSAGPLLEEINAQDEINFHNIDLTRIFSVAADNKYHYYLENMGRFLNPVFYLTLAALWVVLPFLKGRRMFLNFDCLTSMPSPSKGLMVFFFVHMVVFGIVDLFFFNVSYIFELFVSLAAAIVALDMSKSIVHGKVI